MWLVFTHAPPPDARYWPGRRLLALADAIAWPVGLIGFVTQLPQSAGFVGLMVVALAALATIRRVHRAGWQNHRYHFTTWRWGRVVIGILMVGPVLKMAMQG